LAVLQGGTPVLQLLALQHWRWRRIGRSPPAAVKISGKTFRIGGSPDWQAAR
jgi:hypothetical protein